MAGDFKTKLLAYQHTHLQTDLSFYLLLLNVAGVSAYCIGMWRIKYFTEQNFPEFFLGQGIWHFRKGNSRWPCCEQLLEHLYFQWFYDDEYDDDDV